MSRKKFNKMAHKVPTNINPISVYIRCQVKNFIYLPGLSKEKVMLSVILLPNNVPECSNDYFSSSEVWVITCELLRCIDKSFQHPLFVMHSAIKLIDLCHKCINDDLCKTSVLI